MKQEIKNKIRKRVPNFVFDSLYEDYTVSAIGKIREGYIENDDNKMDRLKDIVGLTILKDIIIEKLSPSLKKELNLDNEVSNKIALILLTEILYPIKDYFPGIEDEILKLGGEVPKMKPKKIGEQLLKRDEEMEEMQRQKEEAEKERMKDTIIEKSIKELIKEFPEVGEQQIGSQKAIIVKEMPVPMKPLIKYWMSDYLEKMGNYEHSNIDRVKYVYHDKNTRKMNDEERRQLNLVLKSLDEGILLAYSTRRRKIDFSKNEGSIVP